MTLKQSRGWFAAGREFSRALLTLTDGAFKVYVYACLRANRRTGQLRLESEYLAQALRKDRADVESHVRELCNGGVCILHVDADATTVLEISDDYWPYVKLQTRQGASTERSQFVRQVREFFLAPACVKATFSPSDELIAEQLYDRHVTIEQVRRAVLLGSARKYISMINGEFRVPITSLKYFEAIITELVETRFPESYWSALGHKVKSLEKKWIAVASRHDRNADSASA